MIATQDTAGGNLLFLRDNIVYPKDEFHQGELYEDEPAGFFKFFDSLNSIAEKVPAGSNGVLYTPWLFGERVPVDDPTVRAALYNLSLENTREDIVRAIMEGVALNTRWLINPMEKFIGGRALDPINMVGGGATSRVWCQIMADVLNRSIRQVRDPIQANARGAAFIASVGLGHISFDDVPRLIQFDNVFQPNAEHRQLYDELFEIFVEIYKKNKGIYQRLNKDRS
jgi:xylulokinase